MSDEVVTVAPEIRDQSNGTGAALKRWLNYKVGGQDSGNLKIIEIIHLTQRGAIYLTPGDTRLGERLSWDEEENIGAHWNRATADAIALLTQVRLTIDDPIVRGRAIVMIGISLARALETTDANANEDFFVRAREFVTARQREILQIRYFATAVVTFIVTTIVLGLAAYLIPVARDFLIAALVAGVGGIISVSQRFRSVQVEPYTSRLFTQIGGGSRICFACIFGAIFLLFQKAGIVLSVAAGQPFLMMAGAFVAGFSERAIPELLEQFERQIASRKKNSETPAAAS